MHSPIKLSLLLLFAVLSFKINVCAQPAYSFTGPVAVFTYDNAGNRIKREIKTICVGIGCPPVEGGGPSGRPASRNDSLADNRVSNSAIEAYPNPTENELYIDNKDWRENDAALIVVYDINSKVIIKKETSHAKDNISFTKAIPGTYMVQYYLNNIPVRLWKIVKP